MGERQLSVLAVSFMPYNFLNFWRSRSSAAIMPLIRLSAAASVTYTEADGEPTTEDYDVVCWAVGQRVESPESWPFPRD